MSSRGSLTLPQNPGSRYLSHITLRDLVETVSEELNSENDQLVAMVVGHLLDSGKVRFASGSVIDRGRILLPAFASPSTA